MEGDVLEDLRKEQAKVFQSTPSAWRETDLADDTYSITRISIHSLRMEGD